MLLEFINTKWDNMIKLTEQEYNTYKRKGYKVRIHRIYGNMAGLELAREYELGASYVMEKK